MIMRTPGITDKNRRCKPTPPLFGLPLGVTPWEFRRDLWHQKNSAWAMVFLRDPAVLPFWYRAGLWRTDRQTVTRRLIYRTSIALRGKKRLNCHLLLQEKWRVLFSLRLQLHLVSIKFRFVYIRHNSTETYHFYHSNIGGANQGLGAKPP